jgi:hypothetical protein
MHAPAEAAKPVPVPAHVAQLREHLLRAVSGDDIAAVMRKLVELAKDGDLRAARLVLHYTVGKPGAALPVIEPERAAPAGRPVAVTLPPEPSVNDLIARQIRQVSAADTKREKPADRKPMSAAAAQACARTSEMSLVNLA